VVLNAILAALALLSLALMLWQWLAARRFPLHQRLAPPMNPPALTLLKPLKGCDAFTEDCLRSWFTQQYPGPVQILFGVASAADPVAKVVRKLQQEFPASDAQLIVCGSLLGTNAKVAQLAQMDPLAKHDLLIISDADVRVPPDLLTNLSFNPSVPPLLHQESCGLACCFYRLANPSTLAMQWEAIAINADFWSQVLQSRSLKPIDFALGAVMATRRKCLEEIGGFKTLADCLADDYQLGNRIARSGHSIAICPVVVECWSAPMGWAAVWKHQLRWARTIRVCQPVPYFFSILSNPTLWPLLWLAARPAPSVCAFACLCLLVRMVAALDLQRRLSPNPPPGGRASSRAKASPEDRARGNADPSIRYFWLVPVKDLLQAAIWLLAFLGNRIEWRGHKLRLRQDGTLERLETAG
jgi:ceramide glucosyltransferase